ncbi:GreA/GreB family elongation factor [Lacinutrix salivirga]
MKYGSLILEKKEYVYLKRILNMSGYSESHEVHKPLQLLNEELKTALIVDEEDMPKDVIRLNSKVTVATANGWENTIQVVKPTDKDLKQNKISILTPMGSALIGYSKDDVITWDFPKGKQDLTITNVSQDAVFSNIDLTI